MSRRFMRTVLIIAGVVAGATLIGRRLGYNLGTNTIVRCRQGHLFTTIWIPGVKLKELDLVVARVQRSRSATTGAWWCPSGLWT